ncbi:hypothetical protein C8R43DRAFT_1015715 [Mycena crocata]|nr:hypothetical protein C8R43DRAFT_1015715 [Mycena crocata]
MLRWAALLRAAPTISRLEFTTSAALDHVDLGPFLRLTHLAVRFRGTSELGVLLYALTTIPANSRISTIGIYVTMYIYADGFAQLDDALAALLLPDLKVVEVSSRMDMRRSAGNVIQLLPKLHAREVLYVVVE